MAPAGNTALSTLLRKSTLDDHHEILKASNESLKQSKGDPDVQLVKVIALLKLERYEEASRAFENAGNKTKEDRKLEYAYTLYKTGRLQEAAEVAGQSLNQRGARHLEAQALYRLEEFPKTARIYKQLSADAYTSADDLRVNRGAIEAQLQWSGDESAQHKRPGREDLEAFETAFNAACGSIARGELAQAEVLLKRAKSLCQRSEDLAEEVKADELLPINTQYLYVLQRLGKTEEAQKVTNEITVDAIPDPSTRNIAQSNVLISSTDPNPFRAHKAFRSRPRIPESDRLFSFQSRVLAANAKTVDLQAFKFDAVASSTAKEILQSHQPTTSAHINNLSVLNAAAHSKGDLGRTALRKILPELEKRPNDVGLLLTTIQLYVLTNNTTSAINLLEALFKRLDDSVSEKDQDVRFSPGLISILLALYKIQGQKSHVQQELAKAGSYWRHRSKPPSLLLRIAGVSLLDSSNAGDDEAAKEIFSKLREQDPNDKATIAGYIASHCSTSSGAGLQSSVGHLTPLPDLISSVNVDALESAGIPQSSNALAIAQSTLSRKRKATTSRSNKPKRIRKSRLPKDYDPTKTPDPERWLPLRDRSTYKPKKGKKGKKAGDDRTQGGVVDESLNVTGAAPKPSAGVVTGSGGGGGAGKNKKKGKGKK